MCVAIANYIYSRITVAVTLALQIKKKLSYSDSVQFQCNTAPVRTHVLALILSVKWNDF